MSVKSQIYLISLINIYGINLQVSKILSVNLDTRKDENNSFYRYIGNYISQVYKDISTEILTKNIDKTKIDEDS